MENSITLFLMSRKGFKVLEALGSAFPSLIAAVVVARDRNVQDDHYEEIRSLAERLAIPCFDRRDAFTTTSPYAIAVSWRWLIDLAETRLVVFHDSLLPKYRGFNPLVSYLINGEPEIGVTALFASEEYDRGDIIGQEASKISYPLKIAEAVEIVSENYVALALQIADRVATGSALAAIPQNEAEASYSLWRDERDYRIDWNLSASRIRRFIDAVGFPYSGASALINGVQARLLEAEELEDVAVENRTPGKVIFIRDGFPIVVCGEGLLKVKRLVDAETGDNLLPLRSFRTRFD